MLSDCQKKRYDRQIMLRGFGERGQEKLLASSVLVVGLGGLGSIASLYLAAAGVGRIGLADADNVSLTNLQRQVLYRESQVGQPKAQTAAANLAQLNSECSFEPYDCFITKDNAAEVFSRYDLIMDATDNFRARYLINDTCFALSKPFVYASISETSGQVAVFDPLRGEKSYRSLYPEQTTLENAPAPSRAVIGVLPCTAASIATSEAIKYFTKSGELLLDKLLCFDLSTNEFNVFEL